MLLHEVQASGCPGVGSVGISQTLILIFTGEDDADDDSEDEDEDEDDNDPHIIVFSDNG